MEALLRPSLVRRRHQIFHQWMCCRRYATTDTSLAETLAAIQANIDAKRPGPYVRLRLHPDWKQVDNKVRRMESRLSDFRIMSNDLRIQKARLEKGEAATELEKTRLVSFIKQREEEVTAERISIHSELVKLTASFVEGAEREYSALRKFFLVYVYHSARKGMENMEQAEFDKLLVESEQGITFEHATRGTITIPGYLCKKIATAVESLVVNTAGVDTSPLAIALAILQAFPTKHCSRPNCRREDCIAVKADHEELYECFFKITPRSVVFQKARGELSLGYDSPLNLPAKEKPTDSEAPAAAAASGAS